MVREAFYLPQPKAPQIKTKLLLPPPPPEEKESKVSTEAIEQKTSEQDPGGDGQ